MQITEDTARHLGVADRLDPAASTHRRRALPRRRSRRKLPARIAEPDRTWLALAAFNIGVGHLEDARILAQRQKLNPDLWADVTQGAAAARAARVLQHGEERLARGGMPVAFVDRVRAYYDILRAPGKAACSRGSTRSRRSRHLDGSQRRARGASRTIAGSCFRSLLLVAGLLLRPGSARADAPRHRLPRGTHVDGARGPHPRRRDDASSSRSAAPSRTARTWRSASTTSASKALAEQIARALGNALVAPVIAYVPEGSVQPPTAPHALSGHDHRAAPTSFDKVLESAARSLRARGFRDIVFLGDHGGYQKDNATVARELNREWAATPVRVHAIGEYYRVADRVVSRRR